MRSEDVQDFLRAESEQQQQIAAAIVMVTVNENTCNKYVHGTGMMIEKAIVTAGGLFNGRCGEDSYRGVSGYDWFSMGFLIPEQSRAH